MTDTAAKRSDPSHLLPASLSRRGFIRGSAIGAAGFEVAAAAACAPNALPGWAFTSHTHTPRAGGANPTPNGQKPPLEALGFNRTWPGPRLEVVEGDLVRANLTNSARRLSAWWRRLHVRHAGSQPRRAMGRGHRMQEPWGLGVPRHILPHAEGRDGMFGMVTALVVQ